ncbi:MAG: hypothetical protein H7Y11_06405 [Armatimonadetes bacterium]|nr:hypothetical protein [Anaerolineae bacterium]
MIPPLQLPEKVNDQSPPPKRMRWWLPALLALLLIAGLVGSTIFLTPRGFDSVANFMVTCLCLLPLTLCLFPLYLGVMLAVYGMARLNHSLASQLNRVDALEAALHTRIVNTTATLNRRATQIGVSLAWLDPLLTIFERPTPKTPDSSSEFTPEKDTKHAD